LTANIRPCGSEWQGPNLTANIRPCGSEWQWQTL